MEELSYLMSSLAQACKDRCVVDVREHLMILTFNIQTRILTSKRFFGENLSDNELAEARELLAAGTDTSTCRVEWALLELLNNPDVMRKGQEELDVVIGGDGMVLKLTYLETIVKETFRIKGATTIVIFYSVGRDPKFGTKFWSERFLGLAIDVKGQDFELIPFGAGRRICPGMSLGLKTIYLTLGNLLHDFNPDPLLPVQRLVFGSRPFILVGQYACYNFKGLGSAIRERPKRGEMKKLA
ncbi:cytochrome P450 76C1 [Selaginella moellendorffii]|uniref:cytochrome P450 76C1 n=1 Tax=Selaginella moellendorffii TaxID=88036 RepID=UPI000D1CE21D|nr:cytochrome P450 76C1 [Selaginella moellendorffii]|eukprot:XP_024540737.1 cytochrome P450 76C1 [Selaginella moellendorffii]